MKKVLILALAAVLAFSALTAVGCKKEEEPPKTPAAFTVSTETAERVFTVNSRTGDRSVGEFVANAGVPGNSTFKGDAVKITAKEYDYLFIELDYTKEQLEELKSSYGKVVVKVYLDSTLDKYQVRNRDGAHKTGETPTTPSILTLAGCTGGSVSQSIPPTIWKEYRISLTEFLTIMDTGDEDDKTALFTWLDLPDDESRVDFYIGDLTFVEKSTL